MLTNRCMALTSVRAMVGTEGMPSELPPNMAEERPWGGLLCFTNIWQVALLASASHEVDAFR